MKKLGNTYLLENRSIPLIILRGILRERERERKKNKKVSDYFLTNSFFAMYRF